MERVERDIYIRRNGGGEEGRKVSIEKRREERKNR